MRAYQNLDRNLLSLSLTIFCGMPNLEIMQSQIILSKSGAVQVALQGIKVTHLENLLTIVKTESNPSEVDKWVIKSIVTYSNGQLAGSNSYKNPMVPKLKFYSTTILHIPYKIFEQQHVAQAKKNAKILKHAVYTCLNTHLKEFYVTLLTSIATAHWHQVE